MGRKTLRWRRCPWGHPRVVWGGRTPRPRVVLGLFGVANAYLGRGGAPRGTLGLFGAGNAYYLGRGGAPRGTLGLFGVGNA